MMGKGWQGLQENLGAIGDAFFWGGGVSQQNVAVRMELGTMEVLESAHVGEPLHVEDLEEI